jgi:anaphase-promoting complex subunit 4
MAPLQELELFSSSALSSPVTNGISACNPTVDLLATASDTNVVNIWRAHGQLVARNVERNHKIESLRWKPDGTFLVLYISPWTFGLTRFRPISRDWLE